MLILTLRIGDQNYALPTSVIVEVVPLVSLRPVPQMPECLAGVCNYRGKIAPVVDLSQLILGTPCRRRLCTRIVFVEHPGSSSGVLGVMAEGVTETLDLEEAKIEAGSDITSRTAPYLGPIVQHEVGMIQLFELGALLPRGMQLPELPQMLPAEES